MKEGRAHNNSGKFGDNGGKSNEYIGLYESLLLQTICVEIHAGSYQHVTRLLTMFSMCCDNVPQQIKCNGYATRIGVWVCFGIYLKCDGLRDKRGTESSNVWPTSEENYDHNKP